jgi:hypothetical protein
MGEVAPEMPLGRLLAPEQAARLVSFPVWDVSTRMSGLAMNTERRVVGAPPS